MPPPDNVYFPPLGELLLGETPLLSWKLVASALVDGADDRLASKAVATFLKDAFVLELLKTPATAFAAPTPQTAAALETRTAAINVTPASTDQYDIQAIKADTAWLSKAAGLNEVAALRIVVIELQARHEAFLGSALSSQDVANVRKAASGSSLAVPESTQDADELWADFGSATSQRRRLVATYLSERRFFSMAVEYVTSAVLGTGSTPTPVGVDAAAAETLRQDISTALPAFVGELRACLGRAEAGIEASMKAAGAVLNQELALAWVQTALTEAVHYLSVVFLVLQSSASEQFLSPAVTVAWFEFVGDYRFLDGITPADEAMAELVLPLKTLACVNSLLLLNLNRAIGYLDHDLDLGVDEEPYLADSDALATMHRAIVGAAEAGLATASPVFLSWSLIIFRMDTSYQERAERRDAAQNQRAQDGFEEERPDNGSGTFHLHQVLQPRGARGRRSSVGSIVSIEAAKYDAFLLDHVLGAGAGTDGHGKTEPLAPQLAKVATDECRVYDVIAAMAACAGSGAEAAFRGPLGARLRLVFLDVLKASFPIVGYQADPVSALLAVLDSDSDSKSTDSTVARAVLEDARLMQFYVSNALGRFPYEFTPFAALARLLLADGQTDAVMDLLLATPTLTFVLPRDFREFTMVDDADHATATMQILEDLPLFPAGARRRLAYAHGQGYGLGRPGPVVPAGTYGRFLADGSGIVNMDYEHSTIALLGRRLDANLADEGHAPVLGLLAAGEVAEAIQLLTALVRSEMGRARRDGRSAGRSDAGRNAGRSDAGLAVIQEASRDLGAAKDIVSVVCDTLDTFVQDGPAESDAARMGVLAACTEFLEVVLPLCPGRVWSYMARCPLLTMETSAGRLCILAGASDVADERFTFLMASVRLLGALVQNATTSAVQRRVAQTQTQTQTQTVRGSVLGAGDNRWLGASDKTLTQVCLSLAQTVVDVYENTTTWKFASLAARSALVAGTVGVLRDVVVSASSLESSESDTNLLSVLQPAARFVTRSFVAASSASLRFQPLLAALLIALETPVRTLYTQRQGLAKSSASAVLELAASLLRASPDTTLSSASALETHLFQVASLPARLCASASLRAPALALLTDLVVAAAARAREPPSLLGFLGAHASRAFLGVLLAMDAPFRRPAAVAQTWQFFATILRHRQQWMANCLLTGKTPREALQDDKASPKNNATSALSKAKAVLCDMATKPHAELLAVLDFFSAAQDYWPWTIFATRTHDAYLDSMRAYVRGLAPAATTAKTDPARAANEARIAAYVAETFAMQLYHLRQMGAASELAAGIVQDVDYFLRDGVAVAGYNASLHANFARNFGRQYPGVALGQLKRALGQRRAPGPDFYYSLGLAGAMLGHDAAWAGASGRGDGFAREMQAANVNLSLVDAQIALFRAWEALLLELSACLLPSKADGRRLSVVLLQLADQCLAANQNNAHPEAVFASVAQGRADLALLLLQRLAEHGLLPADVAPILLTVWTALSGVESPWSHVQLPYYRTLLRMLYVVLRGSLGSGSDSAPSGGTPLRSVEEADAPSSVGAGAVAVSTTQTILNVLDRVVAPGFCTLVNMVHEVDANADVQPADLALVTAVLQACLAMPGLRECQAQVLNIMATHDALHVATSLYSWADKLLVDDRDPVYGELSLLFLLELSTLPVVAEQLACDGFLGHLTTAGLVTHMRRPGVSPFAESAMAQRAYSIWAKAVLPLLVNMLVALGTSVAPEVAYVLVQFAPLLDASVQRFEAPGLSRTSDATLHAGAGAATPLTLLAVAEVHSLALLTRVLDALRANHPRDIPPVAWDAAPVLESADFWLARPKLLRERLVPLGPRECAWRNMPPLSRAAPVENRLEEKVHQLTAAIKAILSDDADE